MNDEQIKRNAEEYYDKLDSITIEVEGEPNSIVEAYIAGAYSRDEEIKQLEAANKILKKALEYNVDTYEKELNKLRNPWISVDDRLPEKTRNLSPFPDEYDEKVVLVINKQGGKRLAYRDYKGVWRDDYTCEIVNQNYAKITNWMPIPEVKKGE